MMECRPEVRAEIVKDACPLTRLAVPRLVSPSRNVTVPVGMPDPGAVALTVAVAITGWPKIPGFGDAFTATVGTSRFTICVNGEEVFALKLLSPEYEAVMVCAPTANADVVNEAAPVESSVAVPMVEVPSRKVTVPVGVPEVALTVAVKVSACPKTVGFLEETTAVVAPAVFTVKVAAPDVTEPDALVNTAW